MKLLRALRLPVFLLLFVSIYQPLTAQDAITFESLSTENHFSQYLTFKAAVATPP